MNVLVNAGAHNLNLEGILKIPAGARAIIIFVHGSGSGRLSPRNQYVARVLNDAGIGTLLFDLLTKEEESQDAITGELRFNIRLLANRVVGATEWLKTYKPAGGLLAGYFGASTGASAALVAAAEHKDYAYAVVSRGGRPDLAGVSLPQVTAPTLLIVGGDDTVVIELNKKALAKMECEKKLEIVPGATHLFEEPGALEQAAKLASDWFLKHLPNS